MPIRPLAAATLVLVCGCLDQTPPQPAPETLDGNMRWWFARADLATDAEALDAAAKLAVAGRADSRTTPLKSQMGRLMPEDLESVGLRDVNDPSYARGFLVLNVFPCTLEKLAPILVALDQGAQYPGVYDAYARTYTSDAEAWAQGQADTLTWDVTLKASLPVADQYTSQLKGGVRRVRGPSDGPTHGDLLLTRTWLVAPAVFATNSGSYFRQDYQTEVYWEQEPGRIFHAYGMWREMRVGGFNLSTENDGMFNLLIDNLLKWDDTTAALCAR